MEGTEITAITETWLKTDLAISPLCPTHYRDYRTDREDGRNGGGALLLVSEDLVQQGRPGLSTPNVQVAACTIKAERVRIAVACVYRSPQSTADEDTELLTWIEENAREEKLLLLGDFNAPDVNWEQFTAESQGFGMRFTDVVQNKGLIQHVREATRYRPGQTSATLDLILTKTEQEVTHLEILPPWVTVIMWCSAFRRVSPPQNHRRNSAEYSGAWTTQG